MVKLPKAPLADEDFDAPTLKRSVPAELRSAGDDRPPVHATSYVTTKLRKVEIEALLRPEREKSGTRPAVSDEDIERFERRETRETLPAPPELADGFDASGLPEAPRTPRVPLDGGDER
ncbi:MAG: hypothetical protein KF764_30290 [Labilithrix sp.]|nr:hypothetical protein [Labilithrix sp.]